MIVDFIIFLLPKCNRKTSLLLRTTRSGRFINFINQTNLGAQKGKNLRTPHSVITAPNSFYVDKFTVLLHKSQGFSAVAGGDIGDFYGMYPCSSKTKWF
jgi:hypothetical protein